MVWSGGHTMVYGMAWWAWRGISHGQAGIAWYMVWPGCHGLAGMASHGIWYGLTGMAWYMIWPDGHGMLYRMAWRALHGI